MSTKTETTKSVLVENPPVPAAVAAVTSSYTKLAKFSEVKSLLSKRPLRHANHVGALEDEYDRNAIEAAKRENVYFSLDDVFAELDRD